MVLCTYCGSLSITTDKCSNCKGHFDLLSRQRTQNSMGPWFIRDQVNPFHPGCSYDTLRRLIARGRVRPDTVMRGPTTRQFWSFARNTPGVAHLLGACHACHTPVDSSALACPSCNASFVVVDDRQQLGLAPIQMLPGDADPSAVADAAFGPPLPPSGPPSQPTDSLAAVAAAGRSQADSETQPPVRQAVRPSRRRSKGPMVAVVASVGCAMIALVALVYMNRAGAATGSAVAADSRPGSIPTENARDSAERRERTRPQTASQSEKSTGAPATTPRVEDAAGPAANEADPINDVPGDDQAVLVPTPGSVELINDEPTAPVTDQGAGAPDDAEIAAAIIGQMTSAELAEARRAWAADGQDQLVQAADRRAQQLRLRAAFADN
ncbi:MAG: hypothetical protein AAFR76_02105 [Planctomycetota bacterium]